jgi:hypothetical protein
MLGSSRRAGLHIVDQRLEAQTLSRRNNYRYLGNKNSMEVHDLDNEDTSRAGCQIDEIFGAGHAVRFEPDTLARAHALGYDNCAKCLAGSTR